MTTENPMLPHVPPGAPPRPRLVLDPAVYEPYFTDAAIAEEAKRELLEALWAIVVGFVDLGFELHPVQQAGDGATVDLSSALSLMVSSDDPQNGDSRNEQPSPEAL